MRSMRRWSGELVDFLVVFFVFVLRYSDGFDISRI